MDNDKLILDQRLRDSNDSLRVVEESSYKMLNSMRGKSMAFYNRLSLMSGGILSLSITYIGYLSSVPNREFSFAEFLFVGWVFLLVTIIGGLYRNHFNLDMGHYQVVVQLSNSKLEVYKHKLEMLQKYPSTFINLKTPESISQEIDLTKKSIKLWNDSVNECKIKEKLNSRLWILSQNASHIGFVFGLLLITLFASFNLPVSIDFTLVRLLFK